MTTTRTAYVNSGDLYDYRTGTYLRPATEDEERRSMEAAETDGGAGAIEIVDEELESRITYPTVSR